MTVSEPPGDDTALLVAAVNQAWAQYDAEINRGYQVVNYYIVATAVVATAHVGAINGKHYLLAAVLALSRMALTTVTFLMAAAEQGGLPVRARAERTPGAGWHKAEDGIGSRGQNPARNRTRPPDRAGHPGTGARA